MLVLSRNVKESLTITDRITGKEIKVKVLSTRGAQVSLGFEADKEQYQILRDELADDGKGAR